MNLFAMLLRFLALLLFALVAGSVFGIWRGYDPTLYSAATFLEVHQGAVGGLNHLLPGLAIASIALTLALAWFARRKGPVLWLYLGALFVMVAAGLVTRLVNQPLNTQIIGWTVDTLPGNWTDLRSEWWRWHLVRTALSVCGLALLIAAVVSDRSGDAQ
jgi:uncharacterized membrane protein